MLPKLDELPEDVHFTTFDQLGTRKLLPASARKLLRRHTNPITGQTETKVSMMRFTQPHLDSTLQAHIKHAQSP